MRTPREFAHNITDECTQDPGWPVGHTPWCKIREDIARMRDAEHVAALADASLRGDALAISLAEHAIALAHAEERIEMLRAAHEANACEGPWVDGAQTEIARGALIADDAAAKEAP